MLTGTNQIAGSVSLVSAGLRALLEFPVFGSQYIEDHSTPNKNGSYGVNVGVRMP